MSLQQINRAVMARPGSKKWRVVERPMPTQQVGHALLEMQGLGTCMSDPHIIDDEGRGSGEDEMVMGHEGYARVVNGSDQFKKDTLVGIMVRGLTDSEHSLRGFRNHDPKPLKEKGIFDEHGIFTNYTSQPDTDLIAIPDELGDFGALGELWSVAANMVREVWAKQGEAANGTEFSPSRILVGGSGSVSNAFLGSLRSRLGDEVEIVVVGLHPEDDRHPGAQIANMFGATYRSWYDFDRNAVGRLAELSHKMKTADKGARRLLNLEYGEIVLDLVRMLGEKDGEFDLVGEACTDPHFAVAMTSLVRKNGVSVFSSIPARHSDRILPFTEGMLWNKVIFTQTSCGVVNAADVDWKTGIENLVKVNRRYPEALRAFISHRLQGLDSFGTAIDLLKAGKDTEGRRPVKIFIDPRSAK